MSKIAVPTPKQLFALGVVGGLATLTSSITQNVTKQNTGLGGFIATVLGAVPGAYIGLLVIGKTSGSIA